MTLSNRRRPGASAIGKRLRRRPGFTIAELIVAMLIITVGLVALAGSSLAVLRQMELAQAQTLAATIAQSRMERLRSMSACTSITSGSDTVRHMPETWTATTLPLANNPAKTVVVTVKYLYRKNTRTYTVNSVMPCK